jgi:hypothetical protein
VGHDGDRIPPRKSAAASEFLGELVDRFGPFAVTVGIAFALVALVTAFIPRMLGRVDKWTYLTSDSPPFLVKGGAQIAAVAVIGVTFVFVDKHNYRWFLWAVLAAGVLGLFFVNRFDQQRKIYVVPIPLVGVDGSQLIDRKGKPQSKNVVIGDEENMLDAAKKALQEARVTRPLSVVNFMAGYGDNQVNQPDNLWDRRLLAKISNRLTRLIMFIILAAVLALFWAALVVSIALPNG